jgi:hypothetical protein
MDEWKPFPKQEQALVVKAFEVLFGGARGPGKTDTGIAWLLKPLSDPKVSAKSLNRYRALVIRKNSTDLTDWLDRASFMYSRYGAKLGTEFNAPVIRFPSGAKFRTGHLKDEQAYSKYVGHEYQRELIEELNQIPNERRYLQLISSCRSTVDGLDPRVFATTNPGGLGHNWIKKRFVDIAPPGEKYYYEEDVAGAKVRRSRIFIHATMDDNPVLMQKDPGYVLSIEQLKEVDPSLYRAWRFGDWDVFAGQVFKEFRREMHVLKPLIPKAEFPHFLWIDWGYSGREGEEGAFAALLSALIPVSFKGINFNRVITYKEFYGRGKSPDEWAQIIYANSPIKTIAEGRCDPAMFNPQTDGSMEISAQMEKMWERLYGKSWVNLKPGSRNRIARVALLHNWLSKAPDGRPYWLITENCLHLIRTLPMLVYDEHRVEDVDTEGEDHLYDASGYGLSSVKWIPAHLGGVGQEAQKGKALPELINELDLDEFTQPAKQTRDWRI